MSRWFPSSGPTAGPLAVQVSLDWATGLRLYRYPMASVEVARAEFGATLADAKAFVLETQCQECGTEAGSATACASCGEPVCGCYSDPHDPDVYYCAEDLPVCGCRDCTDD